MKLEKFINYFANIPVSINNLYGDPFFYTQIGNTFKKLDNLKKSGHKGIVSIITKSEITEEIAFKLSNYIKDLKLVVLVSISELPYRIEKVDGNRYNTLSLCEKYNIPSIPYIRPFIPNENTDETTINNMFEKIIKQYPKDKEISVIISGLRGNDEILKELDQSEEEIKKWNMRVKTMPKNIKILIYEICKKNNINIFERTACGVSYVLGYDRTYNPYYSSPQLANCFKCPMKETCYDKQETFLPTNDDLELINFLGYNAKIVKRNLDKSNYICTVKPDNRKECISCCTSCFKLQRDSIEIEKFKDICLGDIGLLRLLTNKLVFCKDIIDNGASDIAKPKNSILKDSNIYILNSWYSYSKNINACYKCSYCIVPHYQNQNKEYGEVPVEMAKKLYEKIIKSKLERGD